MIPLRPSLTARRRGLTLIELTVVIAILAMLMMLAVPAVSQIVAAARTDASKAIVAQLEVGCLEFREEIGWLPRSSKSMKPEEVDAEGKIHPPEPPYPDWTGSQLLRLQLTGYAPDKDLDGMPGPGDNPYFTNMDADDGYQGFGFRILCRGQFYGPYQGTEELDFVVQDDGRTAFIDAFANEIFYYRAGRLTGGFDNDDNDPKYTDGSAFDIATYGANPAGGEWRRDFLIFSAGADGMLKAYNPGDENPTDDITNFLPEN